MPPRQQKCICPCGYVFYRDHYQSASFFGVVYKDSEKNRLGTTNCPKCGRKLSLDKGGFNPLYSEK